MSYPVPAGQHETLLEIKKSKFHSRAGFVDSRDAAMRLLEEARARYPDAGHHCWAYVLGAPHSPRSAAMADDGEPSGTAGKPILNVLQHKDLGDVMVVVSRYFGGVKLGAGGLVRAYAGAAQQVIEALPVRTQRAMTTLIVQADFKDEQYLRHWATQHEGNVVHCGYQQHVELTLAVPDESVGALRALAGSVGFSVKVPAG
ncbi:YigZ family protein [Alteromonas sp. ASW11-19]|uniref:YigZ family protein n=1 Tax=Alteromonas salexigens TaxID=2982530 RepID=A0ABT2VRU7_9ALTE|nr:YigZ family protein [Alteromonas salexigens]MCU7556045.1 YigZ family protein [Alteromonas salexigens]